MVHEGDLDSHKPIPSCAATGSILTYHQRPQVHSERESLQTPPWKERVKALSRGHHYPAPWIAVRYPPPYRVITNTIPSTCMRSKQKNKPRDGKFKNTHARLGYVILFTFKPAAKMVLSINYKKTRVGPRRSVRKGAEGVLYTSTACEGRTWVETKHRCDAELCCRKV